MNFHPQLNPVGPEQNLCYPAGNRFIYVKQNFLNLPAPKVLVNPHFKQKVFVNPQFKPPPKPKIHVNLNVLLKKMTPLPKESEIKVEADKRQTTVISTRTKIVRIPQVANNNNESVQDKIIVRKRRTSLHTQFKIVRSSGNNSNNNNSSRFLVKNKFKLDKRVRSSNNSSVRGPSVIKHNSNRKKYVYVNRFLSMSVMAKSVLLKQTNLRKPGFVNVNGIMYKKSPNSLKRALESASTSRTPSRYKFIKKQMQRSSLVKKNAASDASGSQRRSLVKRFKIIRSKKVATVKVVGNKLRKCNIPCPVYRRFGKCRRKESGTCFMLHNPDQIFLCTRFLQGACLDNNCLLSHKVSPEKMPTCKYYLEGFCSRDDCPYLHVKISAKAEICRDFLEGFCKLGAACDKRHQFLCPDFEKNQSCPKKRCPYPHGNSRVRNVKKVNNLHCIAKKCSAPRKKSLEHKVQGSNKKVRKAVEIGDGDKIAAAESGGNRYYKDLVESKERQNVEGTVFNAGRPKLGDLPAFIPLLNSGSDLNIL